MIQSEKVDVFYRQLGKIFYAVAMSDKTIREEEYLIFQKHIENDWVEKENLLTNTSENSINQIKTMFDWMSRNKVETSIVLEDFEKYKNENDEFFTPEINESIFKTANAIAALNYNKNKSELIFLTKLENILKAKIN